MILNLILRLTIWFLLTRDLSGANILIGMAIAVLLPQGYPAQESLKEWLIVLGKIVIAIPQAFLEAFEMIFHPHHRETITLERVKPGRSPNLIFLDIFLITFTPKTIVLKYHQEGWYEVHRIDPGK